MGGFYRVGGVQLLPGRGATCAKEYLRAAEVDRFRPSSSVGTLPADRFPYCEFCHFVPFWDVARWFEVSPGQLPYLVPPSRFGVVFSGPQVMD